MWDKRETILAVIVLAALYCKVAVAAVVTATQLDMASGAVDDQYTQCRDKVLQKVVEGGLLKEELSRSEEFKKAWNANKECSKLIPGGLRQHTAAMLAYANGGKNFRKTFNDAVETLGGNASVYHSSFPFKSLHFLLMDSMKLLNKGQCQTVYSVSKNKYTALNSSEVRFGRFTSARSDPADVYEDPDLEGGVLFIINSCFVLNLEANTCNQELNNGQLLSPSEVFTVEDIQDIKDDYEYTKIILKHSKLHSYNDCYLFPWAPPATASTGSSGSPSSSTQWLGSILLVLMALSLFLFTC